ncbi:hypothetical protein CEXT_778211 [Caerostris extrusa]|uniref:Uncharacterized protein n=1 Tax=Caerostris extrusa TaxID=172846 RepID=A0AAV4R888_CAEEX|nr:hypothetical protein CEXT_778211 [Caerostris extrusa]
MPFFSFAKNSSPERTDPMQKPFHKIPSTFCSRVNFWSNPDGQQANGRPSSTRSLIECNERRRPLRPKEHFLHCGGGSDGRVPTTAAAKDPFEAWM